MRAVYITHPTAHVGRSAERLLVRVKGERVEEIRAKGLVQLILMGNITVSPSAIDLLLGSGIDTVFLTGSGRFRGRLTGGLSSHIRLRLAQFRTLTTPSSALHLAKALVRGKLQNQRALLLRSARRHGGNDSLRAGARALAAARMRATLVEDSDSVRGCEGSGAAAYFRAFPALLRTPHFAFEGRSRRPPLDPVNALLSLGYTLLRNVVRATLERVGLDPFLGALHEPQAGRDSLACDLVEEFRVPIVDALVVAALNRGSFEPTDFEYTGPEEPVILKRETVRWFVELFERRIDARTHYEPTGKRLRFHDVIEQQARAIARFVLGEGDYLPFAMR